MGNTFKLRPYSPKKRYIPKVTKHEAIVQSQACRFMRLQHPSVIFRSDFASGLHMTPFQAKTHASLQSGRAWPDIFIYEPRRGYNGAAFELKRDGTTIYLKTGPRKGKLTANPHIQEQAAVLQDLTNRGYYADFCIGIDDFIRKVNWYFGVENTELF